MLLGCLRARVCACVAVAGGEFRRAVNRRRQPQINERKIRTKQICTCKSMCVFVSIGRKRSECTRSMNRKRKSKRSIFAAPFHLVLIRSGSCALRAVQFQCAGRRRRKSAEECNFLFGHLRRLLRTERRGERLLGGEDSAGGARRAREKTSEHWR